MNAPPLRDPIGLVDRSPELAPLAAQVPALKKAIERGRPHDAYRALFWAAKLGKIKGELGDTAKALLQHRRVFFKPLAGAPTMFTYNGVGTSLYGRSDVDGSDGTYVATLYAVFVFVPIFPIASYLVRDAQNAGRRAWTFMAKVPMSSMNFLWQRAIAAGIMVAVALGAANAFEGYGHNTLHVVNGLARPVTVEVAGSKPQSVPAGGEVPIRLDVGSHAIAVKDGAEVLESSKIDVPRGRGAVVWNVLGAAPLYVDDVVYSSEGASVPSSVKDKSPDVMCGESFVTRDGLDYAFEEPPKSIDMPKGSSYVTKTRMAVAPGGLSTCTEYLVAHQKADEAAHLALAVAKASRTPAAKMGPEMEAFVVLAPKDEAESFTKDLLARDDSVDAHRLYQDWLLGTNQRDRAVAEYDARAKAHPDDGDAEYLALRVRDEKDERATVDAAVARHPKHAYLRHMQIYAHRQTREFAIVADAAGVLHELERTLWARDMDAHVEALVALERARDAMPLLHDAKHDDALSPESKRQAQFLAYRVGHRLGSTSEALPHDEDDPPSLPLFLELAAGIDVSTSEIDLIQDDDAKTSLRIVRAARARPDSALAMAKTASNRALEAVPSIVRVLLFTEAVRKGEDRALLERLATGVGAKSAVDQMIAFLHDGTITDDLRNLPLEEQSALDFGRSRAKETSAKEKAERVARAREGDVLHGPVTVAIDGWPS